MVRAVLSIVGIVATVAVLAWCFGITMPQVTTSLPAINRSVARTVGLMQSGASENGREPAGGHSSPASAPGQNPETYVPSPATPAPDHSDAPEIIGPDSTAHLNPAHIRDVDQPGFPANPPGFVAPDPLPAHPHWAWDIGNREFTNVVVTHVDADLVTITSDSGPAQIDIALLPLEIRRELNYDPALAAQAAVHRAGAK